MPMTIFGDGKQTRGFSYIDDVAPIISVAPEVPKARSQAFFVRCSNRPISLLQGADSTSHYHRWGLTGRLPCTTSQCLSPEQWACLTAFSYLTK